MKVTKQNKTKPKTPPKSKRMYNGRAVTCTHIVFVIFQCCGNINMPEEFI